MLRWKSSLLAIACLLVYLHLSIHCAYTRSQIITTANAFDLVISDTLSIQNDEEFVTFTVESGLLNGSNTNLDVDTGAGHLVFYAEDNCELEMELITERTISVSVVGCTIESTSDTNIFIITILSGNNVEISWGYNLESYADKYTVLAFGIVGVCMMVFAPVWGIRKILNDGLEVETVERVGYAILVFMIGLGLFITFLYW